MKIIVLANRDIASNYALNLLLPAIKHHDIAVFLSAKVGGNNNQVAQLKQLQFFEQDLFNQGISPLINAINNSSTYQTFTQLERCYLAQPIEQLDCINRGTDLATIKNFQPHLIISIRFGQILKEDVLNIPAFGVLNLHSGILPDHKGVMATFWAMLNDQQEIGTTLHYINDSTIDTGEIVAIAKCNLDLQKSYLLNVLQLYLSGVELVKTAIANIESAIESNIESEQRLKSYPQPKSGGYYTFPKEDDLVAFANKGYRLVDENELLDFIMTHYYQQ